MGEASFEEDAPFQNQPLWAAAVVCRTEYGTLHAGVLHREWNGQSSIINLGWQDVLTKDWNWRRLWAVPDAEPERLLSAAGMCDLVWQVFLEERTFPYGLGFADTTFDLAGRLVLGPGAKGLTCATFVLAIFNSVGLRLVDEVSWPVREKDDRAFLERVRTFATPAHFELLVREVDNGVKRIQPQEVIGACACTPPAAFSDVTPAAQRVMEKLAGDDPGPA